jgi:hypothetical protein
VLENDGDQLDRSITQSQGGQEYLTYIRKRKAKLIGHVLHRNYLLKHLTVGKIEERIGVKTRRERRCKQSLDDLK